MLICTIQGPPEYTLRLPHVALPTCQVARTSLQRQRMSITCDIHDRTCHDKIMLSRMLFSSFFFESAQNSQTGNCDQFRSIRSSTPDIAAAIRPAIWLPSATPQLRVHCAESRSKRQHLQAVSLYSVASTN